MQKTERITPHWEGIYRGVPGLLTGGASAREPEGKTPSRTRRENFHLAENRTPNEIDGRGTGGLGKLTSHREKPYGATLPNRVKKTRLAELSVLGQGVGTSGVSSCTPPGRETIPRGNVVGLETGRPREMGKTPGYGLDMNSTTTKGRENSYEAQRD